ncbi:MAG: GAF domain-containing protein, partial [Anaerolineales bacterium]|nr:GAF domain-containing protein [Anaerolineales bacterium]
MSQSERTFTGRLKTMWHGMRPAADAGELTREELLRRYEQEQILGRVIALSTSKQDLVTVLDEICYLMTEYYDVPSSGFAMLDEAQMIGTVIASYARPGFPNSKGETLVVEGNLATEHILRHKRVLAITDAQTDPLMAPLHGTMRRLGIVSILIIPIVIDDRVVATLGFNAAEPCEFDMVACEFGERVAIVIGSVLQRVQADEELERERKFAQRIMSTMGQGLVVVDEHWRIEYGNETFARLVDLPLATTRGKPLLDFMPPADRADLEMIYMMNEGDLTQNFDTGFICSHGQKHYVMLSLVPRQPGPQKSGHIVVVTDVSERKAMEAAQQEARDQAIEASRLKSEFLANMSHEIRTPLNGVIGMTSLLLNTPLNGEQQDYCETIKTSGELLLALINDILDFSKIEAGKLELEMQPFDVRSCVEDALDVIAAPASAKGLELAYWLHESVPPAMVGDVTRLRQIMVNLLSNAV